MKDLAGHSPDFYLHTEFMVVKGQEGAGQPKGAGGGKEAQEQEQGTKEAEEKETKVTGLLLSVFASF